MAKAERQGSDLKNSYMFWLPFTAVFREGIETVIFLAGTSSNYEVRSCMSLLVFMCQSESDHNIQQRWYSKQRSLASLAFRWWRAGRSLMHSKPNGSACTRAELDILLATDRPCVQHHRVQCVRRVLPFRHVAVFGEPELT